MDDRIQTLHPQGKRGVNIDKDKYETIREAILNVLEPVDEIAFRALPPAVAKQLPEFDGSVSWYTTTVKLDLEARGLIERVPDVTPQHLRLTS